MVPYQLWQKVSKNPFQWKRKEKKEEKRRGEKRIKKR
jgi:hypothetical protein